MNITPATRLFVTWAVLVAVTLIYLVIDGAADVPGVLVASTGASVAAISLALVKVRIILRELMGVRHAPKVLRTMTDALVATMGVFLLGTYLIGTAIA